MAKVRRCWAESLGVQFVLEAMGTEESRSWRPVNLEVRGRLLDSPPKKG